MNGLSNKFNSLLNRYQETYQDFLNTINSNDNNLTTVSNSAFIGDNSINTIQNSTVDNCLSECGSNTSCSGATFDNNLKTCTMISESGNIASSINQTAIVKQGLYYSNKLKELNDELISLNNSMMQNVNKSINNYSESQEINNNKNHILNQNYNTLQQEREEIEKMIREYETLNSAYENGNINVTSNYYSYIIYLFITIFLVFMLLRVNLSGNQVGGRPPISKFSPLIFIFLGFVIILNAYLKN